jgi:hypothetical protein
MNRAVSFARVCAGLAAGALTLVCAGCDPEPTVGAPSIPFVEDVPSPLNQRSVLLRGTKQSATSLLIDGRQVLPVSEDIAFSVVVDLREGSNVVNVSCVDARGVHSGVRAIGLEVDTTAPDAPTLDALLARTVRSQITVTGTKPADARLFVAGDEQVGALTATGFSVEVALALGAQTLRASTMDALENESAMAEASIERFATLPLSIDAPADELVVSLPTVNVSGTRGPGVVLQVGSVALPADAVGGAWATDVALALGENEVAVRGHFEGEPDEEMLTSLTVHYHPIPAPPVLDATPARAGATVQITGSKPANTALERDGVEVVPLGPETTFVDDVPLAAEGSNTLSYETVSEFGQRSTPALAQIVRDTTAPTLALDPALDGALVGDVLAVAGAASDADPGLLVELCVGGCALDADFTAVVLSNGTFDEILDLAARADLTDGALATVHARATDSLGLRTEASADVVLSRVSVPTGQAAGSSLAIASLGAPFAIAIAKREVTGVTFTQDVAAPVGGYASETLSDPAALALGDPRMAGGASGWVAFAEASARTSSADTTRGALAFRYDGTGAQAPAVVTSAAGGDVVALDVAQLPGGEAAVAFVVADAVSIAVSSLGVFGAPVIVSDAAAVGITDVRIASDTAGALTVAWLETSARDGTLDDSDIVARRFVPGVGPDAAVVPVSVTDGGFTDAGSDTLALVALPNASPNEVAVIGTVNGGEAWLFVMGGAPLSVVDNARIEPEGDALALALASDGDGVIAVVQDAGALLGGAPAPGVAVLRGDPAALGAPLVVSTLASSQPAAASGHVAFVDSRGIIVRALVEAP